MNANFKHYNRNMCIWNLSFEQVLKYMFNTIIMDTLIADLSEI